MPINYTPLINGQAADAATLNGPLQELDSAIEALKAGSAPFSSPTITSFANAQHTHHNASNGGQLSLDALHSSGATTNDVPRADGAGGVTWAAVGEVPIGAMLPYAGASAPTHWLLCSGQAISRTTYAALFAVIGSTYGSGDGSTTFNLPDMRGRLALGLDNMGGSSANRVTASAADDLGGSGGAETHSLSTSQLPAHTHSLTYYASGSGGSTTGVQYGTNAHTPSSSFSTGSTGSGNAVNHMNPWLALNWVIRAV